MIIAINIILALAAVILFTGVCGEKDKTKQTNITFAFITVIALIITFNMFM